jgi:hypothetical protein
MKRMENVATEMALHVLAYNMTRVIAILGVPGMVGAMRAWGRADLCARSGAQCG